MADQRETTLAEDLEAVVDQLGLEEFDEKKGAAEATEEVEAEETVRAEEEHGEGEETERAEDGERAERKAEPVQDKREFKPPVGWGPKLRSEFKNLPKQVQERIHNREVEINTVLQQTAEERKTAHQFNQVVSEFRGLMAAEGVQDPIAGVRGLLTTTAQLAMGNQQIKARKIADLIKHYQVDIEVLDATLAGESPRQNPNAQLEQMIDQRLAPVNQLMQQIEENRRNQYYQVQNQATQTIEQFKADRKNEFFEDVKLTMADFLDMAAQHNQHMSLQEAYDRACAMNPEIAQVIMERRAQGRGQTTAGRAEAKRRAASSVSGKASGNSNAREEGLSIREALESAMGDAGRI